MRSKLEELKELRDKLNIEIEGVENFPANTPTLFVANHNCLMDIFYMPMAVPVPIVSLVSARVMYKKEMERQAIVNKYLYPFPIEMHCGKNYANICLKNAALLLLSGTNLGIFPEGAYSKANIITRGRTGTARILYCVRDNGLIPNLVPIAIDLDKSKIKLDDYTPNTFPIKIKILEPINYDTEYNQYLQSQTNEERNASFHSIIDKSMLTIAHALDKPYKNEYIPLNYKNNVMLSDGTIIDGAIAEMQLNLFNYEQQLEKYTVHLQKALVKEKFHYLVKQKIQI